MKTILIERMHRLLLAGLVICLLAARVQAQYATEIVVAQDGSGDFTRIQDAIDQAKCFPDKRITIFIKSGIYREKVRVHAWNTLLTLKGENAATTIISGADYFDKIGRGRNSTFHTYTLLVQADDFQAEELTIENTAGPVGQAVALAVEADRCVFRDCRILGYQDTLYTAGSNSRQYFLNCYIEGSTDFIFGPATVLFDSCTIHSKSNSYITAAGTPMGKRFGFVFRYCRLSADPGVDSVYLGRPWRDFARVVFLYCDMGAHIRPEGWSNWAGTGRDKTAFYAEFGNSGQGAGRAGRAPWSRLLSKKAANQYALENILKPEPPVEPGKGRWAKEQH
ncbi:MAG: pectin esterase [Lewinellaceae bacterium]|nr:pectin esterase [Lewinellaceae bacterium]